jgi:hypothetical protein
VLRQFRVLGSLMLLCILAVTAHSTPHAAPVPPTLEIEILDPNVDPLGMPAAIPKEILPGLTRVDIPSTVLVHKYYYSGDRSFQARFVPGGPTIVVANHPKTGERLYIPVMMVPGAPKVTYTSHAIAYDFGNQTICIQFCWLTGRPEVHYSNHVVSQSTWAKLTAMHKETKNLIERTGLPNAGRKLTAVTKNVTETSVDNMREAGKMIIAPVIQVGKMIPGINTLTSHPEDRASSLRDVQIQKTLEERLRQEGEIKQNR